MAAPYRRRPVRPDRRHRSRGRPVPLVDGPPNSDSPGRSAGRTRARIDETLAAVGATPDGVLIADVDDAGSISDMVAAGRVVANLVGPYARYGEVVHAACAAAGVHQLDLTGEIAWVRRMIDSYQLAAEATGAAIVPTAGFESLPFDVGAALAAETAWRASGSPVVDVDVAVSFDVTAPVRTAADAVSGGTYASIIDMIRSGDTAAMTDPDFLDPNHRRRHRRFETLPHRHAATGSWLGPMIPSPFINPPVLHRSAALSRARGADVYAPSYRYREGAVMSTMMPGPNLAAIDLMSATTAALGMSGMSGATRLPKAARAQLVNVMERIGPKPGEGPRPETLDDWRYRLDIRATTESGSHADVTVDAIGHPGYKSTATIIGEAALALAAALAIERWLPHAVDRCSASMTSIGSRPPR